jgi:single-strand selective monofunctional uracil DNA glycosylase
VTSLVASARRLKQRLAGASFSDPVAYVYNPLEYAWARHKQYLETYGSGRKRVLLLGMNPGPWGMAQTGVPFGDVAMVRDWLGISGTVRRPKAEHPKRPIEGFSCARSEVSGTRVWSWARETFGTPKRFFRSHFIGNYCPLVFMEEGGKNRTPDKLPTKERSFLFAHCDQALRDMVDELEPDLVVGIGTFAEGRAQEALAGYSVKIGRILHPSPASPAANRGWAPQATKQLLSLGVAVPGQ